jgi:hypothetical protein
MTRKRTSPHHIVVKMPRLQNKEGILKSAREKYHLTFKGKIIKITSYLSAETLKVRKAGNDIFQALEVNNYKTRLLYSTKLSFTMNWEIKTFHDKQKLLHHDH